MQFNNSKAIYLQIADHVYASVLSGDWKPGDRVPSVRDLAESLEVNPNTVMRTFSFLQDQGILYNQRGIGFFLAEGAYEKIRALEREEVFARMLPVLFAAMTRLDISIGDVGERWEVFAASRGGSRENEQ
jgi:GntR family transcriptional regulator